MKAPLRGTSRARPPHARQSYPTSVGAAFARHRDSRSDCRARPSIRMPSIALHLLQIEEGSVGTVFVMNPPHGTLWRCLATGTHGTVALIDAAREDNGDVVGRPHRHDPRAMATRSSHSRLGVGLSVGLGTHAMGEAVHLLRPADRDRDP